MPAVFLSSVTKCFPQESRESFRPRNACTKYNCWMTQLVRVDVVGVGLNETDTLIQLSDFPERGSKTEYGTEIVMPGGQVASTVVACQTWGLTTRYVGKLGDDDAASLHAKEFLRTGAEAQLIHVPEAASSKSL